MSVVGFGAATQTALDEAAAEIVAAHGRILAMLRKRVEPLTPAEIAELADLEQSAEAWLRVLRRNVAFLTTPVVMGRLP